MHKVYVVTGTLTDVHTVTLDEALPLKQVKVRLLVELLEPGFPAAVSGSHSGDS